jgi:hypothetical protein
MQLGYANVSMQRLRFYGILSIAEGVFSHDNTLDYSRKTCEADVYRQVFETYTYQTQGVDLLASCECSVGDRTEGLPSRVLDMNAARQTDSLLPFQLARGVSGTEVTFQGNVIRVSGLTVGQVVTVYEPFALNNDQAFEILRKLVL